MTNDSAPLENGATHDSDAVVLHAIATENPIDLAPDGPPAEPAPPSFADLNLHPDVKLALDDMGYFTPTPVQTAVFGLVTEGKDLLVQSRTGTGKTTAFGLPIISKLVPTHRQPQAMILAPTRELALQVARELTALGKHRGIVVEAIYGGAPIGKQITALRNGVHIIVGTPGRVLDHIGRRTLDCKNISTFVLDECDEMLSMGFLEDIERVVSNLPEKFQTALFSATMPDEVTRYARRHMKNPETVSLSRDGATVSDIHHAYYIVSGIARSRDLLKVIFQEEPESAIIFCNTRDETTMVAKFLQKQGLDAEPLSSDLSQADRERVMGRMKKHDLRFLCATDVAARGIDISNLSHVINYSVPESPEVYVHRTGRTGRAGKKGVAVSLVGPRELGNFRYVRLQFKIKPEERVIPKDDIFEGKLKVPLPPIGTPQAPDPVQILIRGVAGQASELERQIFEKLLVTASGKRVLAKLVADKLDQLSTKNKPRRPRVEASESADGQETRNGEQREERGEREGGFGEDRPRFRDRDRGERGDRPRFGDRDRGDRGDRPRFGDRDRGGERGDRGDRGDRPRFGDRDRDRGERRFDRDRDRDRDRGERREHRHEHAVTASDAPAVEPSADAVVAAATATADFPSTEVREAREHREERGDRDRDRGDRGGRRNYRDRFERGDRDRDREPRESREVAPVTPTEVVDHVPLAAEPVEAVVEHKPEPKVDEIAARHVERADRGGERGGERGERKGKRDRKAEPTAETREFWETWAEEKSTRPAPAPAPVEAKAEEPGAEETAAEAKEERPSRGRDRGGRGRDRDRGEKRERGEKRDAKSEKPARDDKREDKRDDKPAAKKDTAAAAAGADGQARLFVNLGKKHGVSADDLRTLLAGPIGGDTARIGSVSLRDSHAHVRVPEELAEKIISGVHGTSREDHSITVERARA